MFWFGELIHAGRSLVPQCGMATPIVLTLKPFLQPLTQLDDDLVFERISPLAADSNYKPAIKRWDAFIIHKVSTKSSAVNG